MLNNVPQNFITPNKFFNYLLYPVGTFSKIIILDCEYHKRSTFPGIRTHQRKRVFEISKFFIKLYEDNSDKLNQLDNERFVFSDSFKFFQFRTLPVTSEGVP